MDSDMTVKSHDNVGRKPAKNPLSEQISFRIDESTAEQIDAVLEIQKANNPGLVLSRGDMVRMLVAEALAARSKKGAKK